MDVRNRRVTVMGLGSFGGGVGVARFLAAKGARVTVTDLKPADELQVSLDALGDVALASLHLGGHREDDFTSADLIVASPAVPIDHPLLETARRNRIPVTTEVCLFCQLARSPIVGVTGSNGKSTTSALIHALLGAAGRRAWLGGNIGGSLLESADEIAPEDVVVLELSSFQLEWLAAERRSPHVAVVTNFSPNHLDRHGTLAAYRRAKQGILRFQSAGDVAILNDEDPDVRDWPIAPGVQRFGFGFCDAGRRGAFLASSQSQESPRSDSETRKRSSVVFRDAVGRERRLAVLDALAIPGRHNVANALAAIACAGAMGADEQALRRGLAGFRGLAHRLERVAEIAGRVFYNDSIATTPESTCAALEAFEAPLILIAGGYDKGIDLEPLAVRAFERAKGVALIGKTGPVLLRHLDRCRESRSQGSACEPVARHHSQEVASNRGPAVTLAGDLEKAIRWAWEQSVPGDVIVLSPGCASYDQFRNFEHRGNSFREQVRRLGASDDSPG